MNYEDKKAKFLITDTMRDRLRALERGRGINHNLVANNIRLDNPHKYKNIFNTSGSQKYISYDMVYNLAKYFHVSIDYITGDSDDPNTDKYGHAIPKVKKLYENFEDMYNLVSRELRISENYELLANLYFLFHDVSSEEAKAILRGINSLITPLKKYSFLNNTHNMTPSSLEELKKAIVYIDNTKIKLNIAYGKALNAIENNRYKKALCILLQIILDSEAITIDICRKATYSIYSLQKKLKPFPTEIRMLFPAFEEYSTNPFNTLSDDTINTIEKYLSQNENVK